jgi:flagellar hook-associated protein 3 FlgL
MRVTNTMQHIQLLKNLRNNNTGIIDWQNKLATGRRIHKPGDDPVGVGYYMRYNSEINRTNEFLENANTGLGFLNTMDEMMQQTSDVLKRARVLVQQASTGTTPDDARQHIAAEIQQLKEQLVMIGNSSYSGRYLFNGQKTDQRPYSLTDPANDRTDRGVYYLNVSPNVSVPVSISGEEIFGEAGAADNAFRVFDEILAHLNNNELDLLRADMERIDGLSDRINSVWAEIGARTNRFELVKERIQDQLVSLKDLRSKVGDADMAEAIIELTQRENVLQASLAVGARIMQVSLIDFIR